ncbi:MAG: hypothetical protein K2K39_03880 [Clostridia bacterium]|nr:hypothetical protein [Clostridia bacterium]
MKKIYKLIVTAVLAVAAVFACLAVAGCDTDKNGTADYVITVLLPDGTPVNGKTGGRDGGLVDIQICLPGGACVPLKDSYPLGQDGKVSLSQANVNGMLDGIREPGVDVTSFEFHARHVPGCTDDVKIAVDKKGNHTLTLTESVCEHKCLVCGKCTAPASSESACAEKCPDHTYTINVTANGADLSGVKVKIANGEKSMSFSLSNGGLEIKYKQLITTSVGAAASYTVTLENVPQGYTCSPASKTVSNTETVTFTLTAAQA